MLHWKIWKKFGSRGLDQLHEKRLVEYYDYKWSVSEMANIRAHGEDQVAAQKKKTAAVKAELKEAKIKALEKAAQAGGKKKGFS